MLLKNGKTYLRMTDHRKWAEQIIALCGGKTNIASLDHCATRLRLKFADESIVDKTGLKTLSGIVGLIERPDSLHIVVGAEAINLFKYFF